MKNIENSTTWDLIISIIDRIIGQNIKKIENENRQNNRGQDSGPRNYRCQQHGGSYGTCKC